MLLRSRRKALPDHIEIDADGTALRIRLRPNARAKRYLLRIPADHSGPVLTVPGGGDLARAERFVRQHVDWLLERLEKRGGRVGLIPGSIVPVRGEDHEIRSSGKLRGLVQQAKDPETGEKILLVPGADDHVPRKVETWLKAAAKADLTAASFSHAQKIGAKINGLTIRDTKSRWGSCASNGKLSFSWRLILAPPDILDYVAAHEVAHLREMNHSARFWALCQQLAPQTPAARQWLKDNGLHLHGYG
ncbi:M48 family metallopeptidase [Roseibium litorale]|uniref:M48 family metallopeptidase n=1 Tax=Roseibium litorale TaxID=2803841 RepID=A0ABR9CKY6_9HYPH|nr:SprT family zinc-dependent metalloprotease [Roseibium litorale]MBD8891515.1 M48 family metallopeptidase [Roseibium litorale]